MAEFQEVMRQVKRLCARCHECESCPLYKDAINCPVIWYEDDCSFAEVERIIMDWAAEHTELRYPTWKEWYQEYLPDAPLKCPRAFVDKICGPWPCDECLSEPIPADIAQKLGIKPITEERGGQ